MISIKTRIITPLTPLLAAITLLAGCASRTTGLVDDGSQGDAAGRPQAEARASDSAEIALGGGSDETPPDPGTEKVQLFEGTGEFFDRAAAASRPDDPGEDGEVVFNFEGQPLQEVVKAILGDLLSENYVIAPGVSGTVTFSTAKPIRQEQALAVLEMLLSWNNAALAYFDGRYNVMPLANVIKGQLVPTTAPAAGQRGYEVRVFPLDYIAPAEMQKLLQPYARDAAFVAVDNPRGLLVLAGTRQELANYQRTIDIFDVDWLAGMSVGIYAIQRVEAATVVTELESVFGEGAGTPLAGMFRFLPIERLNAIVVITPQVKYLETASEWIDRLDRGGAEGAGTRLYVYKVKNVKATDLSDTLNDVFGGSGSGSSSQGRRGTADPFAPGIQTGEITSINDARRERQQASGGADRAPGNNAGGARDGGVALVDGEEIRITAVEEQNSLLIRATPGQYEAVLGAIKRLDTEPLQVLVEVKVYDVELNDSLTYGVQWFFENSVGSDFDDGGDGSAVAKGIFDSGGSASPDRAGSLSGSGFAYQITGGDVSALVSLLENETTVTAIAAPSMLVLNNREANINVGDQIPVNSPVFNTGAGNDLATTRVQFRDTGVTMNVVPRVNPGGLVFLEIRQEVSSPGAPNTADPNGNVPVSQTRLDTEVAVQSGETIVLGGLIQNSDRRGQSGLPVLSQLPVVGGLFGTSTREQTRNELLVVIKPTVVANMSEAREVSEEYRKMMRGIQGFDVASGVDN
ncbi:MAG: type II secretion system secretin GspD [Pseudomonadota bacterium]